MPIKIKAYVNPERNLFGGHDWLSFLLCVLSNSSNKRQRAMLSFITFPCLCVP